jgi:CarD family transcriptional regulator
MSLVRARKDSEGVAATPITAATVTAALEATASKVKPMDADPFRKGGSVVYPTHGVGRIDHLGLEDIAGHKLNLINISFDDEHMTLRVPVARARSVGLRNIATRAQLTNALITLKGHPRVSRLMWAKRAQEYLAKINSGEQRALAEVVRDLQPRADGSGRSSSQRNLFELALDRLAAEYAVINRTSKQQAGEQLQRVLLESQNASVRARFRATGKISNVARHGEVVQSAGRRLQGCLRAHLCRRTRWAAQP